MQPTKPKKFNLKLFIVGKMVKKETVNWPRDVKLAGHFASGYPEREFWEYLKEPENKFDSMLALFNDYYKDHIKSEYAAWKVNLKTQSVPYKLDEDLSGTIEVAKKETLQTFLGLK